MGWQGQVRKFSTVDRVARHLGIPWRLVHVSCWRDDGYFWAWADGYDGHVRLNRRTLKVSPLEHNAGGGPLRPGGPYRLDRQEILRHYANERRVIEERRAWVASLTSEDRAKINGSDFPRPTDGN